MFRHIHSSRKDIGQGGPLLIDFLGNPVFPDWFIFLLSRFSCFLNNLFYILNEVWKAYSYYFPTRNCLKRLSAPRTNTSQTVKEEMAVLTDSVWMSFQLSGSFCCGLPRGQEPCWLFSRRNKAHTTSHFSYTALYKTSSLNFFVTPWNLCRGFSAVLRFQQN